MLKEQIDSIAILNQPDILLSEDGVVLSYPTADACALVLANIQEQLASIPYQQMNHQLVIPDYYLPIFLQRFGFDRHQLSIDMDLFYIDHHEDKLIRMARSFPPVEQRQPIDSQILQIGSIYRGLTPHNALAEISLTIPDEFKDTSEPPRVIFMLDCSFSMGHDQKMEMLTQAVIEAIERFSASTRVSVYFYGSRSTPLLVNKAQRDISAEDFRKIREMKTHGNTEIKRCITSVVADLKQQKIFNDPVAYANLTLVWLTDGEDEEVVCAEDFAQAFIDEGCQLWPHLITVGIGQYHTDLLNAVTADARFQTNLMLHIDTPENTSQLFQVVAHNVGVRRRHVGVVIEVNDKMVTEDLGAMQTLMTKHWVMEIPKPESPSTTIYFNVIIDQVLFTWSMHVASMERLDPAGNLEVWSLVENRPIIHAYLEQTLQKTMIALKAEPELGMAIRRHVLRCTHAMNDDLNMELLRAQFRQLIPVELFYHDVELNQQTNGASVSPMRIGRRGSFFSRNNPHTQHQFSQALQQQYAQSQRVVFDAPKVDETTRPKDLSDIQQHGALYSIRDASCKNQSEVHTTKNNRSCHDQNKTKITKDNVSHGAIRKILPNRQRDVCLWKHLSVDRSTGNIDIEKTLITILNDHLQTYGEKRSPATQFKFCNHKKNYFLALSITFNPLLLEQPLDAFFSQWFGALGVRSEDIQSNSTSDEVTCYFSDAQWIWRLFDDMGYETLLNDVAHVEVAYRVDLLQTLMVHTIRQLIIDAKVTNLPPEQIEFDAWGQLSAEVVSPSKMHYHLKNTMEVIGFLKQYGRLEIPLLWTQLLHQQCLINTRRAEHYLTSLNEAGMPTIMAKYQFQRAHICTQKKQVILILERRDKKSIAVTSQERRIFQAVLQKQLGTAYHLFWRAGLHQDDLILSCQPEHEWQQPLFDPLISVLTQTQLLPLTALHAIEWQGLLGPIQREVVLPETIDAILECKIMRLLPGVGERLLITPAGYTYSASAITQWINARHQEPFTKDPLEISDLRPNHAAEQLVVHYQKKAPQHVEQDPWLYPPSVLMNPDTNQLYVNPAVTSDGTTVEEVSRVKSQAGEAPETKRTRIQEPLYPNRCVQDLCEYYRTDLTPLEQPVQRASIRATLGANIGLLCSGPGQLSKDRAKDEGEHHIPYVDYQSLTQTLIIDFTSEDYARRFELGLKRWTDSESAQSGWTAGHLSYCKMQTQRVIRLSQMQSVTLTYHARVHITGETAIRALIEKICCLSSNYFNALQALTDTHGLDALNHILQVKSLAPWRIEPLDSEQPIPGPFNILSMRARADGYRIAGISQQFFQKPADEERSISSRHTRSEILTQVEDAYGFK